MEEIFVPNLHSFAMNNVFTGSCGALRFKIKPEVVKLEGSKEVDFSKSTMVAEFWHGKFCYEKSETEGKEVFPLSEDGRTAMKQWLTANI